MRTVVRLATEPSWVRIVVWLVIVISGGAVNRVQSDTIGCTGHRNCGPIGNRHCGENSGQDGHRNIIVQYHKYGPIGG